MFLHRMKLTFSPFCMILLHIANCSRSLTPITPPHHQKLTKMVELDMGIPDDGDIDNIAPRAQRQRTGDQDVTHAITTNRDQLRLNRLMLRSNLAAQLGVRTLRAIGVDSFVVQVNRSTTFLELGYTATKGFATKAKTLTQQQRDDDLVAPHGWLLNAFVKYAITQPGPWVELMKTWAQNIAQLAQTEGTSIIRKICYECTHCRICKTFKKETRRLEFAFRPETISSTMAQALYQFITVSLKAPLKLGLGPATQLERQMQTELDRLGED